MRYRRSLTRLLPTLGALPSGEITLEHVKAHRLARLAAGRSACTVNKELDVVKRVLRQAVEDTLIAAYPLAKLPRDREREHVRVLSEGEGERLAVAGVDYGGLGYRPPAWGIVAVGLV